MATPPTRAFKWALGALTGLLLLRRLQRARRAARARAAAHAPSLPSLPAPSARPPAPHRGARLRRPRPLAEATVAVIGLGGVGSHAAVALARAGVRSLIFIDFDNVTLSSLNRHAAATRADVGTPKVAAVARLARALGGGGGARADALAATRPDAGLFTLVGAAASAPRASAPPPAERERARASRNCDARDGDGRGDCDEHGRGVRVVATVAMFSGAAAARLLVDRRYQAAHPPPQPPAARNGGSGGGGGGGGGGGERAASGGTGGLWPDDVRAASLCGLPAWALPDVLLDCIDDVRTKAELLAFAQAARIPCVSSLGAGGKLDGAAGPRCGCCGWVAVGWVCTEAEGCGLPVWLSVGAQSINACAVRARLCARARFRSPALAARALLTPRTPRWPCLSLCLCLCPSCSLPLPLPLSLSLCRSPDLPLCRSLSSLRPPNPAVRRHAAARGPAERRRQRAAGPGAHCAAAQARRRGVR
jgi:hypothetical protein